MKQGFRQSMAWLHTWTGLLVGWLLLLIFMAGTSSYYRDEITRWMQPEISVTTTRDGAAATRAVSYLQRHAAHAKNWYVSLPYARSGILRMYWENPEPATPAGEGKPRSRRDRYGEAIVNPDTGQAIAARQTRGGDFFYRLHFDLHYIPVLWARYLVGFCAMFMLVAIITGVITHKKIFKDFFTFRPGKGLRSWLDFHNVSAVMALPYHLMITYTGIVTLMFMYFPWGIQAAYPDNQDDFFNAAFAQFGDPPEAAGRMAPGYPIAQLLEQSQRHWQGKAVGSFFVYHPGDANAVVDMVQFTDKRLSVDTPSLRWDGVTGQLLQTSPRPGAATQTRGVMYGLHLARFADPFLRALFFVSGLFGCLMVASGVILWAVKERPKHLKSGRIGFGLRLVDALNIGTVAGLPIAFAAYFWGNRLLPVQLEQRSAAEADVFFFAWAAALLAAFIWPKRLMWAWQLYIAAGLFMLLPVLNALTTQAHLGVSIPNGDGVMAGVDLTLLALGMGLAIAARRMQRWQPPLSAAQRRQKPQKDAHHLRQTVEKQT